MNELIEAAKAVCDQYDYTGTVEEALAVNRLIDAVERAEKQEAKPWTKPIPTDFKEWWETYALNKYGMGPAYHAWSAGQQAERERIRARAQIASEKTWRAGDWYIGPQHNMIEEFVEELLEDGDE